MKKIFNECVGCYLVGLRCMGQACENRRVVRYFCDSCGCEEKLYQYEDQELCAECLEAVSGESKDEFELVEG